MRLHVSKETQTWVRTSTSKLLVYNATNSAWEEAQSIGNFFISTLSPAFDGSTQDFTITNAPSNAQQIILSINGVLQIQPILLLF